MNAYSEDLRKKIVEALERGMGKKSEAARTFSVSLSSVKRYARMYEEDRSLAPKKRPGSKPKLDERSSKLLEEDIKEHPFLTLQDTAVVITVEPPRGSRNARKMPAHPLA